MTRAEISRIRLSSQKISGGGQRSPAGVVSWLAALQAQDFQMALLAIGVRLSGSSYKTVEAAFDEGDIIRTHLLRPTWHIAAARDLRWLHELTAPRIKASMASRHRQLELTAQVIGKSNKILEKALRDGNRLTREELLARLEAAKIVLSQYRSSHLLFMAELEGILCSGPMRRGKPTYAFFEDRIPAAPRMTRDEALAELARRYFTSRCPATLEDFTWWSGLPAGEAGRALESVKNSFAVVPFGSREYLFPPSHPGAEDGGKGAHFLPAYDEFLISYRDRSAALSFAPEKKVVSNNGMFRPLIVFDGQIAGVWKRSFEKGKMSVEACFFKRFGGTVKTAVERAAGKIGGFYGMKTEVFYMSL
jgi:hypothetical protein